MNLAASAAILTLHEENLPRDTANRGQQSQALERKFPMILPEPLDAAIPEAVQQKICALSFLLQSR